MVQPRILHDTNAIAPAHIWTLPGSTVDLDRGDFLSYESDAAVLMDTVTEDATFIGIAMNNYTSGDRVPQQVVAALVCMIECDVTSATYSIGDGLKYTSKNTLVADGSANTIAFAAKDESGSAATRTKVYVNVPALGKLFTVSA